MNEILETIKRRLQDYCGSVTLSPDMIYIIRQDDGSLPVGNVIDIDGDVSTVELNLSVLDKITTKKETKSNVKIDKT